MPFTGSHPAAVLPMLRRGRWVSGALVTGSVAPDLPSFVPLGLTHTQTHQLSAIGWPDALLGFALLSIWWVVLRPGLTPLLPRAVRRRWGRPGWTAWRDLGPSPHSAPSGARWPGRSSWLCWVIISMFVGLATHLAWDSFTHIDGWTVLHWPALTDVVVRRPLYVWLQLLSSVVGLAIVGLWLLHEWRRTAAASETGVGAIEGADPARGVVLTVWATLAAVGTICGLLWEREQQAAGLLLGRLDQLGAVVKGFGGGLLIGLGLWSLCWLAVRRRSAVGPSAAEATGEGRPHRSPRAHVP